MGVAVGGGIVKSERASRSASREGDGVDAIMASRVKVMCKHARLRLVAGHFAQGTAL